MGRAGTNRLRTSMTIIHKKSVTMLWTSGTGLQSQQWGRKVCTARAVKALCEIGGKGSLAQHAPGIARQLLQVCLLTAGLLSLWHPCKVSVD